MVESRRFARKGHRLWWSKKAGRLSPLQESLVFLIHPDLPGTLEEKGKDVMSWESTGQQEDYPCRHDFEPEKKSYAGEKGLRREEKGR